jgi:hypothetical protein
VTFDFQGNISTIIQIIALILLVIGVYPYRIRVKNRNLILHGFLSIVAIGLNLVTIVIVMIPVFSSSLVTFSNLSLVQSTVVWLHAGLGIAVIVLALGIIFSWITHPLGELACSKMWRIMMPTFIIWAFELALGLAIHIFNII